MEILAPRTSQDTLIRVYKNAFTSDFCDEAINTWEHLTKTAEEATQHDWSDTGFRRDKAIFMDEWAADTPTEEVEMRKQIASEFYATLTPLVDAYLKDVGIYKEVYCTPHNVKIQKYDHTRSGGYYQFHSEQDNASEQYLRRLLTYTLYLNDVPLGEGETEFLNQGFRCQPSKGDLVLFPAFFTHLHRGNPVYTVDKYIATGWMLWDNPPQLKEVQSKCLL